MRVDLVLKNCKIWYKNQLIEYGIAIDDGKIISISKEISLPISDNIIDCHRNVVLPGLIDVHVHFREPGLTWKEDWETGSKAAAHGGITYVFDMPNTEPHTTTVERILEKRKIAEKKSIVNFGLYAEVLSENIEQIPKLAKAAIAFKIYMGKSTGGTALSEEEDLWRAFVEVAKTDKIVVVHAENEKMNSELAKKYKDRKDPLVHALARPPESEITAVQDAIEAARKTKVKLHITHLTTKVAVGLVKKAKTTGVNVTCDVTPHHLFFARNDMIEKGTLLKMNPALGTEENRKGLWKGLLDGTVDMIATDHAPHTLEEKSKDIWHAPSGVPGIETSLCLMLNEINKGTLDLEKVVALMSTNPARRFDLLNYGKIEENAKANLTIVDMKKEWEIKNDDLETKCGWSPFDGWKVKGVPVITIVDGKPKYDIRILS